MPVMNEIVHCPGCGREMPAATEICPHCAARFLEAAGTNFSQAGFVPPAVEELQPRFPSLEILEFLGRGGMGAVYKARQAHLDRIVALKILPPGIGQDGAFAGRFTREARALARLHHQNIVTLYEFGEADGLYYFLMEYVDGASLRRLLDRGRLEPKEALAIVPQICDALQFAHDRGIVHRDIKPENILLNREGQVKIADFGVAKIVAREAVDADGAISAPEGGQTEAGKVIGTPQYMAPEQIEHPLEVDNRADIYSLGVVFYQMLTGELPAGNFEPPSRKVQVDVRLDEVVLRALEKEPELRWPQASVLKTQVETIISQKQAGVLPPDLAARGVVASAETGTDVRHQAARPGGRRRVGVAVLAALGIVLVILAGGVLLAVVSFFFWRMEAETVHGGSTRSASLRDISAAAKETSRENASQLAGEAWELWRAQRFAEAALKFEAAVKLAPGDAGAWNGLGWARFNSGQPDKAEAAFQKALALEPNHPAALNGLGQVYLSRRKYGSAEELLLAAAAQNATAAWHGLARISLLEGKYEAAEKWARMIVDSGQADESAKKMLEAAKARSLGDGLRAVIEPPEPPSDIQALEASLKKRAAAFVELLARGKFPDAVNEFDKTMRENMTAAMLAGVWRQLDDAGGKFLGAGAPDRIEPVGGFLCVYVPCRWERNQVDIKIVYDPAAKVSGLWVVPPGGL